MIKKIYNNQDLKLKIVKNMKTYGGSFVQALAECIARADEQNLIIIAVSFKKYIDVYHPDNRGKTREL